MSVATYCDIRETEAEAKPWELGHLVSVARILPVALPHVPGTLRRSASWHGLQVGRAGSGCPTWFPQEPLLSVCQALISPECTLAGEGNAEKEILLPSEFTCLTFFREAVGVQPRLHVLGVTWA